VAYLQVGDWQRAHPLVQEDESALGCWAHGIVHLLEGDAGNARYWYERAGRPWSESPDAAAEASALKVRIEELQP
jgi:hypothetical protein